jgi:DHA1 family bicyclomycin/chloramphenicol resistance-like MFS transporter
VVTTRERPAGGGWFLVLLGTLMMLPPLSIDISLPGLPHIARALNAPPALLQWTLSAFVLSFGLGQLVLGPLSDRIGRRPVLLGGMTLFALSGIGCAFASDARLLVGLRLLGGIGACAGTVCARAIAQDLSSDRAGATFRQAVLQAVNSLAPIVAPLLGVAILATLGWRWLYGVLALVGIALVVAVAVFVVETSPRTARDVRSAYARVLRLPRTAGLALIVAGSFFGFFALITGSPFALMEQLHVPTAFFALAFALNASSFLIGAAITARLAKSVDPERLLAFGVGLTLFAGLLACALDVFAPSVAGFIATWALYAMGMAFGLPGAFASALAAARSDAGLTAGLIGSAQMLAGAVGSAIGGALPGLPTSGLGVLAAVGGLAAAAGYALSRPPLREQRQLREVAAEET